MTRISQTLNSMSNDKTITLDEIADRVQELTNKICQVDAMLCVTYGEQGESFRNMNNAIQDKFMWGINTITDQMHKDSESIIRDIFALKRQVAE